MRGREAQEVYIRVRVVWPNRVSSILRAMSEREIQLYSRTRLRAMRPGCRTNSIRSLMNGQIELPGDIRLTPSCLTMIRNGYAEVSNIVDPVASIEFARPVDRSRPGYWTL